MSSGPWNPSRDSQGGEGAGANFDSATGRETQAGFEAGAQADDQRPTSGGDRQSQEPPSRFTYPWGSRLGD
jgi:hypothetical protein